MAHALRALTLAWLLLGAGACQAASSSNTATDPAPSGRLSPNAEAERTASAVDSETLNSLVGDRDPASFERWVESHPQEGIALLGRLAAALGGAVDEPSVGRLTQFLTAAQQARWRRLASSPAAWTDEQVGAFIGLLLLDPQRFRSEPALRRRLFDGWLQGAEQARAAEPDRRAAVLEGLHRFDLDILESERLESAWGLAPRAGLDRERHVSSRQVVSSGPIEATLFSLPASLIDGTRALRFLRAVGAADPGRRLVVLTDGAVFDRLRGQGDPRWTLIHTYGRGYSAWPRDPITLTWRPDGGVHLLARPNRQRLREADQELAVELIQGLPAALDRTWGEPTWERATLPFHNGQLLLTDDSVWLSIHSVEPLVLQATGWEALSPGRLADPAAWTRFRDAALDAARRLAAFYGRTPRWVHPLPEHPSGRYLAAVGGGAGWDLDSLLTVVPGRDSNGRDFDGRIWVADPAAGLRAFRAAAPDEQEQLLATYREDQNGPFRLSAADAAAVAGMQAFCDLLARHLAEEGLTVTRVPLLLMQATAPGGAGSRQFTVGWNNLVLRPGQGARTIAEGFASGLPRWDRERIAAAATEEVTLVLYPPLVGSVVRNGGYRCASQHLRRAPGRQAPRRDVE